MHPITEEKKAAGQNSCQFMAWSEKILNWLSFYFNVLWLRTGDLTKRATATTTALFVSIQHNIQNYRLTTIHTLQLTAIHTLQLTAIHTLQLTATHTLQLTATHTLQLTAINTLQLTAIHSLQLTEIQTLKLTAIHTLQLTAINTLQLTVIHTLQIYEFSEKSFIFLPGFKTLYWNT